MDGEAKRQVEIIAGGMNCSDNFECLTEEFLLSHAVKIRDGVKLPNFATCLREDKIICNNSLIFGYGRYCKCKVRVHMSNKHGK